MSSYTTKDKMDLAVIYNFVQSPICPSVLQTFVSPSEGFEDYMIKNLDLVVSIPILQSRFLYSKCFGL